MRRITVALGLGAAALGLGLAVVATGPSASGAIATSRSGVITALRHASAAGLVAGAGPVHVFNLYGAEEGRADRRPANLVLSEFSSMRDVVWRTWGPRRAAGRGLLSGTWCMPGCLAEPYAATVELGAVREIGGKRFFTRFAADGDFPHPESPADTLSGALPTP
ncbi:hypothetical protein FHS43_000418 [Streptosporangium becharense]|uniref:Uncharacterized protein n=1 Tax=Streptosporangium becharense TaxID=1816182 RepID=A0A7W9MGV2_9ACTN|nr:hypothetical protein [Streptosporangium becharense]MBB2909172.1 hypothetical protein [Streptosporangium becharense]MBB5819809.1 hypothetical protein [Streptosporangium becharense]